MRVGSKVTWNWSGSTATGKVKEIHKERITKTIKGEEITRNGSADDPAIVIEQEDGDQVLKLASEVTTSSSKSKSSSKSSTAKKSDSKTASKSKASK